MQVDESERTEEEVEWMKNEIKHLVFAKTCVNATAAKGGWRAVCGDSRAGTQDGRECVRLGICLGTHTGSHEDTHTCKRTHVHTLD